MLGASFFGDYSGVLIEFAVTGDLKSKQFRSINNVQLLAIKVKLWQEIIFACEVEWNNLGLFGVYLHAVNFCVSADVIKSILES